MCVSRLALLLGLLLCVGAQLSFAQHWSHGWYPGGKRELDSFGTSEVGISVCANNLTVSVGNEDTLYPLTSICFAS